MLNCQLDHEDIKTLKAIPFVAYISENLRGIDCIIIREFLCLVELLLQVGLTSLANKRLDFMI